MYEVAVLAGGSNRALKKWIDEHDYPYPKGMDAAVNNYVQAGWCFVAEHIQFYSIRSMRNSAEGSVHERGTFRSAHWAIPPILGRSLRQSHRHQHPDENNNTLKTKGYHLEHNFGPSNKHLLSLLATQNILTFLFFSFLTFCSSCSISVLYEIR